MSRILFVVACLLLSNVAAAADCLLSASWIRHDATLTAQACVEIANIPLNTGSETRNVRLVRLASDTAHGDDARWIPVIRDAVNASSAQMRELGGLRISDVTVLLSNLRARDPDTGRPDETHAAALGVSATECNIVFYKLGGSVSSSEYAFTFAHEIFHCIQSNSFRSRDHFAAALWWVEGSAEYFANRVRPGTRFSDGLIARFNTQSLRVSLLDMDYENVVFFMWLGQNGGSRRFLSFLGGMPETEGRDAQLRALQRLLPREQWQSFIEAGLNGRINKPGGGYLPRLSAGLPPESVLGPKLIALHSGAYVIPRRNIVFQRGKNYPLTLEGMSNGLFVRMRLSADANSWSTPPESVKACDRDKSYVTYWTSVEENGSGNLRVGTPERLEERTCCLIGNWQPTAAAKQALAMKMNAVSVGLAAKFGGPAAQCAYTGGGWTVSFRPDGTGKLQWDSMGSKCTMRHRGGEMSTASNYTGALAFRWNAIDYQTGSLHYTDNSVRVVTTTAMGGLTMRPMSGPMTSPDSANFSYECSNEQLNLNGFYGLQTDARHIPSR